MSIGSVKYVWFVVRTRQTLHGKVVKTTLTEIIIIIIISYEGQSNIIVKNFKVTWKFYDMAATVLYASIDLSTTR